MKILKKYGKLIIIGVIVIFLIVMFFLLKELFYPDDSKSTYGNRLDGIEEVEIESNRKTALINRIKTNKDVTSANVDVKGKIIYTLVEVNKNVNEESFKSLFVDSLTVFSKEELEFYDFQFFGTNQESKFKIIGTKNNQGEEIVWSVISEVEENEEE